MRILVLGALVSWVAVYATPPGNVDVDWRDGEGPRIVSPLPPPPRPADSANVIQPVRPSSHVAPPNALAGETWLESGETTLALGTGETWGATVRVDADALEHIGFHLDVSPSTSSVEMEVLGWDGAEATSLGMTNWGPGLRVLAAIDLFAPRTFWVRARGSIATGVMTVTRTQLDEGPRCLADCERLLQLPLPIDPSQQGYDIASSAVYAYLFGRRDLLMALFHSGLMIADEGVAPFEVKRLSRWDGGQPPSHRSHLGGVDVDISLYTADGQTVWYPLCTDAGQRCVRSTRWNFGDEQMALLIAGFFDSGLFEVGGEAAVFLDRELHNGVRRGADRLLARGVISSETFELYSFRQGLLRHVEPHHHHVHIRVGEP